MRTDLPRASEARLDALRDEARLSGRVAGDGLDIVGGPIPRSAGTAPGYYGQPIVKPPVWTWQVGLYLFVGGTAGMSGVLAFAALLTGQPLDFVRIALAIALAGAVISPGLLIWDLGRPARFLHMLRVFKWRSAMSMGVWTLAAFSIFAGMAFLVVAGFDRPADTGVPLWPLRGAVVVLVAATALLGAVLATYTGVLLGATAIPAWSAHHVLLPFHFGVVGLGSAAAVMELLGFRLTPLNAIGLFAAAVETGIGALIELSRRGPTAPALHEGTAGLLLRAAALLTGPVAFLLRIAGLATIAGACFLAGAIASRYGWIQAGRFSARDPEETIASQQRVS
jgi:polysulfide reductase-like protein